MAQLVGCEWIVADCDVGLAQLPELAYACLVGLYGLEYPELPPWEVGYRCVGEVEVGVGVYLLYGECLDEGVVDACFHDGGVGLVEVERGGGAFGGNAIRKI